MTEPEYPLGTIELIRMMSGMSREEIKGMAAYSFNDHALRNFLETLKDAADPDGIISPGRGGVWPGPYRTNRMTPV